VERERRQNSLASRIVMSPSATKSSARGVSVTVPMRVLTSLGIHTGICPFLG
jgi:hypothetical protein